MIKRLKPVLILSGILVVLVAVLIVLLQFAPEAEETEAEEKTVFLLHSDLSEDPEDRTGVQLDEADSIKIENSFDTYTLVKKAIGTYYMQGKKDLKVNSESVVRDAILGGMSATEVYEKYHIL